MLNQIEKIKAKEIHNKLTQILDKSVCENPNVFDVIKFFASLLFLYIMMLIFLIKEKIINPKIDTKKLLMYLWDISRIP